KEVVVNGRIGDKFVTGLENQQTLHIKSKEKEPELTPAERWERLARKYQQGQEKAERATQALPSRETRDVESQPHLMEGSTRSPGTSLDRRQVAASWNSVAQMPADRLEDFRLALCKRLALEFRLAFAEV